MLLANHRRPALPLSSEASSDAPSLAFGRAHEATGLAAVAFAGVVAAHMRGPVLWVRSTRLTQTLNPNGLSGLFDVSRLIIAMIERPADILWATEEALRSGAAPLVVAEVAEPPDLTPLRRLQLAAEAGGVAAKAMAGTDNSPRARATPAMSESAYKSRRHQANANRNLKPVDLNTAAPICLLISPQPGHAGAVESRWRCTPAPTSRTEAKASVARWRFERIYSKSGPPRLWEFGGEIVRGQAA